MLFLQGSVQLGKLIAAHLYVKGDMNGVLFGYYSAYPSLKWKSMPIKAVTYAGCSR